MAYSLTGDWNSYTNTRDGKGYANNSAKDEIFYNTGLTPYCIENKTTGQSVWYIHRSFDSFVSGGPTEGKLYQNYNKEMERLLASNMTAMQRYRALYTQRVTVHGKGSPQILKDILATGDPKVMDEFVKSIDMAMNAALEESGTRMTSALKELALTQASANKIIGQVKASAEKKDRINFLTQLLVPVQAAVEMMEQLNADGGIVALSIVLNEAVTGYASGQISYQSASAMLEKAITDAKAEGKIATTTMSGLSKASSTMRKILALVEHGEFLNTEGKMSPYSSNVVRSLVANQIFGDGFGEAIAAAGLTYFETMLDDTVISEVQVKGGQKPGQVTIRPGMSQTEIGQIEAFQSSISKDKNSLSVQTLLNNGTYKADVTGGQVKLTVAGSGDADSYQITLGLGLSVKSYGSLLSGSHESVKVLDNKPLSQAINAMFVNDVQGLYAVHNVLANVGNVNAGTATLAQYEYQRLRQALLYQFADNFLSGTGRGDDFAQYLVINGQFHSIYDILTQVMGAQGTSSSTGHITPSAEGFTQGAKDSNTDVLELSFGSLKQIQAVQSAGQQKTANNYKAWQRSVLLSSMLGQLKIAATFHPHRLVVQKN